MIGITVFAYPAVPVVSDKQNYIITTYDYGGSSKGTLLYLSSVPFHVYTNANNYLCVGTSGNIVYDRYDLTNSIWVKGDSGIYQAGNIVASNLDIINIDTNKVFFSVPHKPLKEIIQPNLLLGKLAVVQVATILVSSLVLVMVLKILLPLLPQYLRKLFLH
jgi:hypothetical protein